VASWSSLDYFGRWKALHYAARRFYAPILLSIEDEKTSMAVYVTSDVNEDWQGRLTWRLVSLKGEVVKSGDAPVQLSPLASKEILDLDFSAEVSRDGDHSRKLVFHAELFQDGQRISSSLATFAPNKHLKLSDPGLKVEVSKERKLARFDVSASALARFVEISLKGCDAVFSDNYFDAPAGAKISVSCPFPAGWSLAQVRKAVRIRSLYDSF
jgi:beta-mannosidase